MYVNKQVMIKNTTKQQKCFKTSCTATMLKKTQHTAIKS